MEKEFVDGLYFKPKRENAPEWVLGSLSAKTDDLIKFLKTKGEWVNMSILMSKKDKPYIEVDTWTPEQKDAMHGEEETKKRIVEDENEMPF